MGSGLLCSRLVLIKQWLSLPQPSSAQAASAAFSLCPNLPPPKQHLPHSAFAPTCRRPSSIRRNQPLPQPATAQAVGWPQPAGSRAAYSRATSTEPAPACLRKARPCVLAMRVVLCWPRCVVLCGGSITQESAMGGAPGSPRMLCCWCRATWSGAWPSRRARPQPDRPLAVAASRPPASRQSWAGKDA